MALTRLLWSLSVSSALLAGPVVLFEANRGQTDASVSFVSGGGSARLFLTRTESVLRSREGVLRWRYAGGRDVTPRAEGAVVETRSYIKPGLRLQGVPTYQAVVRDEVYPSIAVRYHDDEYDFVVAPGGDPRRIRVRFGEGTSLRLLADGSLEARVGEARFVQKPPVAFTRRGRVEAAFRVIGPREIGFKIGKFDRRETLTIDPEVVALDVFGGSGTSELVAYESPETYVANTTSANFPGAVVRSGADWDVFVRQSFGGTFIFGGSGDDRALASSANAERIVGETTSTDLPALNSYGGGLSDGFIAAVGSTGVELRYWGGSGTDRLKAIGESGVMVGETDSADAPGMTLEQARPRGGLDVHVIGLGPEPIVLGGRDDDRVNGVLAPYNDDVIVTGDGYWARIRARTLEAEVYPVEGHRFAGAVRTDQAWVLGGDTGGDAVALWIDRTTGAVLRRATFGGTGEERVVSVRQWSGLTVLTGSTTSTDLRVHNAVQSTYGGGATDGFAVGFGEFGNIHLATYYGGPDADMVRGYGDVIFGTRGTQAFAAELRPGNVESDEPILAAPGRPGSYASSLSIEEAVRRSIRVTVEDPSIALVAAGGTPSASVFLPLALPVSVIGTGREGTTRLRVEIQGRPVEWKHVIGGRMVVTLGPLDRPFAKCQTGCFASVEHRFRSGVVDRVLQRFNFGSTVRFENLTPQTIAVQLNRVGLFPSHILTRLAPGVARLRMGEPGGPYEQGVWEVSSEAIPLAVETVGGLTGNAVAPVTMIADRPATAHTVRVSIEGGADGVSLRAIDPPSASIEFQLFALSTVSRPFFVHTRAVGEVRFRFEVNGELSRVQTVPITPRLVGISRIGAADFVAGDSRVATVGQNWSLPLRTPIRVRVAADGRVVQVPEEDIVIDSVSKSVTFRTIEAGLGRVRIQSVEGAAIDNERSGFEVRVVDGPIATPAPVVVGERLTTRLTLRREGVITVEPASLASVNRENNGQYLVTGGARGAGVIRIRTEGFEDAVVPLEVWPIGAMIVPSELRVGLGELKPFRVAFAPLHPATGTPGPEQPYQFAFPRFTPVVRSSSSVASVRAGDGPRYVVRGDAEGSATMALDDAAGIVPFGPPLQVTVVNTPQLSFGPITLGERFQRQEYPGNCVGRCVLRSDDPAKLLLSKTADGPGVSWLDIGPSERVFYRSVGGTGLVKLQMSRTGLSDLVTPVLILPIERIEIAPPDGPVFAGMSVRLPLIWRLLGGETTQEMRPSPIAQPLSISVRSSDTGVAIGRLAADGSSVELDAGKEGATSIVVVEAEGRVIPVPTMIRVLRARVFLDQVIVPRNRQVTVQPRTDPGTRFRPGMRFTATSSDPSRLLIGAVPGDQGAAERIFVVTTEGLPPVYLLGVGDGSSAVGVTVGGEEIASITSHLFTSDDVLHLAKSVLTPFVGDRGLQVEFGLDGPLRPGVSVPVTLRASDPKLVRLESERVVLIGGNIRAAVGFEALAGGRSTILVSAEGYPPQTVVVDAIGRAPAVRQEGRSLIVSLPNAAAAGTQVIVNSSNAVTVSGANSTAYFLTEGQRELVVPLGGSGSALLTITSNGYAPTTFRVTL